MTQLARRLLAGLIATISYSSLPEHAGGQGSSWVWTGVTGRLIYKPDVDGDRIPDFSAAGYGEGKRDIPDDIPVVERVNFDDPGNDTDNIQSAINRAAMLPLLANGFRGVVELGPGKFDVTAQINIRSSGIVLRGAGSGDSLLTNTHIVSHVKPAQNEPLLPFETPIINIAGSGGLIRGARIPVIDKRVPVGAQSLRVASTAGFTVGGMVEIRRPSPQTWIEELGMHLLPPDGMGTDQRWLENGRDQNWHRRITRIEVEPGVGGRLFLDAPITTALDSDWGGGDVRTFNAPNVIRNVGVENLRGQSLDQYEQVADERRTPSFIKFQQVVDGFARNLETRHFWYASVITSQVEGGRHITVDNVHSRLPTGNPTGLLSGSRRYTFAMEGQYSLVKNSSADSGRHDFVTGSDNVGPIVFTNSVATNALNDTGPHQRWGNGLLFDTLDINGNAINVRLRTGDGHGWAGANTVIWNSNADSFIVQNPPTAQNWLIGSTGEVRPGVCLPMVVCDEGIVESHGTKVVVGGELSLYEAQKNDAADIREFHWTAANGTWNEDLKWDQEIKPGVYAVSMREYVYGDYDDYTADGASSVDKPYIDPQWENAIRAIPPANIRGTDDLAANKHVAFTMLHPLAPDEHVVHGYVAMSLKTTGGNVTDDYLRLFNTDSENRFSFRDLGWASATGSPINATTPFIGVIDMGQFLTRPEYQSGSVNLLVSNDVAMDWAIHGVTIAKPIAGATNSLVYIDRGNLTVDSPLPAVGRIQNGSPQASQLIIDEGGVVAVTDDYIQTIDGNLAFRLNGSDPGEYGILNVGDVALLDGTLRLELAESYTPSAGDTFQLIIAARVVGSFSDELLPSLPNGMFFDVRYSPTAVNVTVCIMGDYNCNGAVDAADYVIWRKNDGTQQGYNNWRSNFGRTAGSGAALPSAQSLSDAVPEPATLVMFVVAIMAIFCCQRVSVP